MKKILFTLCLSFMLFNLSFAQNQQEDLSQDLKEMSMEMNKAFEEMQKLLGNSQFLVDTLLLKGLEPMMGAQSPLLNMQTDSLDFNGMVDMMQDQLNQLSKEDWSEINKMMEQFGQMMPMPDGQKNESTPKKDKKGRKIQSL